MTRARAKILIVDNKVDYLNNRKALLEAENYEVVTACGEYDARRLLKSEDIDLAILDVRLRDDYDEEDDSGVRLAVEEAREIPKIILTRFPSLDLVRSVYQHQSDGFPSAVAFVSKEEKDETLLEVIERSLSAEREWMKRLKESLSKSDAMIETDYHAARRQSWLIYILSTVMAVVGTLVVLSGVLAIFFGAAAVDWFVPVSGGVTQIIALLFYQRVDRANQRLDCFHQERMAGIHFDTLLKSCGGLRGRERRESCLEHIILTANRSWLEAAARDGAQPPTEG